MSWTQADELRAHRWHRAVERARAKSKRWNQSRQKYGWARRRPCRNRIGTTICEWCGRNMNPSGEFMGFEVGIICPAR